jgi:tRNA-splicing ligase RtcB
MTPEDYMDVTLIARDAQNAGEPDPRVFDSAQIPAAEGALADLRVTVGGADLAAPPVVLPDFHHKSNMELPSSVAVATRASVRPTLTSASVNCGMALIALNSARPSRAGIDEFYRRVRERYPYPPGMSTELSARDVLGCAVDGGAFAAERFGTGKSILERVEELGRLDLDRYDGAGRLQRELPGLVMQLARLRFGMVGPTNHFIELQEVEEVFDPDTAAKLGVAPGQMTLQYHAGGGVFPGAVGAMFGRRKHYPKQIRAAMSVVKPLYHGMSARSLAQLKQRYRLYFAGGCPPVPLDSDEGRRLMLANAAAMNYGFAFRIAVYAGLRQIATDVFGGPPGQLAVDSPHNSIYEEEVAGQPAVVHRHNSCRAYPAELMPRGTTFAETGQAVLVPGTHQTSSYLCVAGGSADALYSACHGAGTVVSDFARRGISQQDSQQRATLRFRYDDAAPAKAAHFDDKGVDEVLAVLVRGGLVRPVARMRPFAVLH